MDVSPLTMLKKFGITRKKLSFVVLQRCDALPESYIVSLFSTEMFVWADETGSDK